MIKNGFIALLVGVFGLFGLSSVQAASFSIAGGDETSLNDNFDLWSETGLNGESVGYLFHSANDGGATGLSLSGAPAEVTFTYLGSEASASNYSFASQDGETVSFNSENSEFEDSETLVVTDSGLLSFGFSTEEKQCKLWIFCWYVERTADNDGTIEGDLSILFFMESDYSVIALFGDGQGDADYDDMAVRISVSAVPLPPSLLLFAGALLGLGWVSRRKIKKKTA